MENKRVRNIFGFCSLSLSFDNMDHYIQLYFAVISSIGYYKQKIPIDNQTQDTYLLSFSTDKDTN